MSAALWDLDGTIVDSAGDIAAAMDRTLLDAGLPALGEGRVRAFIGEGARRLVDRCVLAAGGVPSDAMLAAFMKGYRAALVVQTRIHPLALGALLPRVVAPMALVTNKPEAMTHALLATLDLARYFPVVIGADTLPTRKPDPEPLREGLRRLGETDGVYVGDSSLDVMAAHAAGMPIIGVDWGIGVSEGADVRVATVAQLEAALRSYGVAIEA